MTTFPIAEIFGPTIQGEGPDAGRLANFVRFGGCDYRCSWCDSMHAVKPDAVRKLPRYDADEIVGRVSALPHHANYVVLSGGNPALYNLWDVVQKLKTLKMKVAVETQGTLWRPWLNLCDRIVISPKPPSSRMHDDETHFSYHTFLEEAKFVSYKSAIKVPIADLEDLDWAANLHRQYSQFPFFLSIVTNPRNTRDDLIGRWEWLIGAASSKGLTDVNILPQLHAVIWGHKLGV